MTNIFVLPNEEINIIGFENQIYGFPTDLKKLSDIIIKITKQHKINYIYGIDLGCGDGKTIDFFNKNIDKSKWIGIELSSYRINLSLNYSYIIEGNMLDIFYGDYNFIYVNNLCFDTILSEKLENKIYAEFKGYILTTTPFLLNKLNKNISLIESFPIDTNWQKKHIFYLWFI